MRSPSSARCTWKRAAPWGPAPAPRTRQNDQTLRWPGAFSHTSLRARQRLAAVFAAAVIALTNRIAGATTMVMRDRSRSRLGPGDHHAHHVPDHDRYDRDLYDLRTDDLRQAADLHPADRRLLH